MYVLLFNDPGLRRAWLLSNGMSYQLIEDFVSHAWLPWATDDVEWERNNDQVFYL